jgi:hypothetical protein
MTPRKGTAKAAGSPSKWSERLKDEVYRQMYRLEATLNVSDTDKRCIQ